MLFPNASRFFVSCVDGRVGSYMLTSMLGRHPQIACYGEIFNPLTPDLILGQKAQPTWEFLRKIYSQKQAAGFKLIYYQWLELPKDFAAELVESNRVIFITRENMLDCYLSVFLARKNKFRQYNDEVVTLDPKQIDRYFAYRKREEKAALEMYRDTAVDVLETTYERLVTDRERAVREICDFLWVKYHPIEPTTKKARKKTKREVIANYEELMAHYAGTEAERYFDHQ